jgi:hypothetical protein
VEALEIKGASLSVSEQSEGFLWIEMADYPYLTPIMAYSKVNVPLQRLLAICIASVCKTAPVVSRPLNVALEISALYLPTGHFRLEATRNW